jgi:hypothetical protein
MVKIQIPEALEKSIVNVSEQPAQSLDADKQKAYCEALCVDIAPMIIERMGQLPKAIDAAFIMRCTENEIQRRKTSYSQTNEAEFKSSIDRPDVGVIDPAGKFVESYEQFRGMVEALGPLKEVAYNGHDKSDVILLQARLPKNYVGSVAWVQRRHIPQFAFDADMLVEKRLISGAKETYMSLCRRINPARTNLDYYKINKSEIWKTYGFVNFKIKKSSQTVMSWFCGLDIDSAQPSAASHGFVLVGAHWKKEKTHKKHAIKPEAVETQSAVEDVQPVIIEEKIESKPTKIKLKARSQKKKIAKPANPFEMIFG